jgi:hypothetical protein
MLSLRIFSFFDDRIDNCSFILLASISIIQFKNEAKEYHQERLERKENAVKSTSIMSSTTTYPLTTENLNLIF